MSEFILKIVNMSISASWLVLAVLLLRLVLKKAPKWVSVLLWGFVAVRLVCPISIESALSLIPSAEPIPKQVIAELRTDVQNGIPQTDAPIQDQTDIPVNDKTDTPINEGSGGHDVADVTAPEAQGIQTVTVLTALWTAGVAGMLVYTAVSYFLLQRKVATAVRLRNNIYQSEYVDSPFVLGIVRPKIYLPFQMDSENLALVIAHEEAHIRRKDHWWKPFGFVLLAIHWFNPLMWVGYILLCRDIELACDEKVIKEMDNETKADYMQALVSCSVNRRSIAACPLAFGEVGVKERVKTMMNYKKPAFWIVIAAVALCIVVAVCFLTDPLNTNKDFDVKLLEYPGLKWGMSPEEVITALELTEEKIVSQKYSGPNSEPDSCYLTVKDITFFDEKVTQAAFCFRRASKGTGDYRLYEVNLLLDENLDMNEMNATLTDIYGEGTGASYTTYGIDSRGKLQEYQAGGDPILAYMYNNLPNGSGKDVQHLREIVLSIVEDPEFMVENWASSKKGTKVLPKDGQELIIKYFVDSGIADRETVEQGLEKATLVAITTQNRSLSAALEASRNSEASESNVTHNQVIYSADMLIYFTELIERLREEEIPHNSTADTTMANDPTEDTTVATDLPVNPATLAEIMATVPDSDDLSMLRFHGIKWGASPEVVKDVLGLTEEQILAEKPTGDIYLLRVTDVPFFGDKVVCGEFKFVAKNEEFGLASVDLYYPDETDMTDVQDALVDIYGAPNDSEGFTRYKVSNGAVESYTDWGFGADFRDEETFVMGWWESTAKRADVLPVEVQEAMIASGYTTYFVERLDPTDPSSREVTLEYLKNDPAVLLYCTNGSRVGNYGSPYYTKNAVSFNAHEYMIQLLYNSK